MLWEPSDFKHYNLNLLDIKGFEKEEKLMNYIKLVMERAVALRKIHLHDKENCKQCGCINKQAPSLISSKFPHNEEENNLIRKLLTNGSSPSPIEIIIG